MLSKSGLSHESLYKERGRGCVPRHLCFTLLNNQCKEIEENNRMGKIRDLFKKIRGTREQFHAKMGSIKYRNGMDLTEAEHVKKKWQEYTGELYRKELHDPTQIIMMV